MSEDSPRTSQPWLTHTRAGAIVLVVGCAAGAWMAMDHAGLWVERIVASSALADANLVHRQSKRLSSRSRKRLYDLGQRARRSQDYLSLPEDMMTKIAFRLYQAAPEQVWVTSLTVRECAATDLVYEFQAEARVSASSWREAVPILARYKGRLVQSNRPLEFKDLSYVPTPQIQARPGEITAIIAGTERSACRPFDANPTQSPVRAAAEFGESGNLFRQACCLQAAAKPTIRRCLNAGIPQAARERLDLSPALRQHEKAIELYVLSGAERLAALALLDLGSAYMYAKNDMSKALECFGRARVIAQAEESPLLDALCLDALSRVHEAKGETDKALEHLEQAIQILGGTKRTSEEQLVLRTFRARQEKLRKQ